MPEIREPAGRLTMIILVTMVRCPQTYVNERYEALMEGLELQADDCENNSHYYTVVDIYALIAAKYGQDFLDWVKPHTT